MTCSPRDHRPHWPAMAGQLLGNGIWKDLRSKRVPDLTIARRPGLRLNTESSAPISAKSSYGRKTWRCRRATPRRCLQYSPPCLGFIKMLRVCDSMFISHSAMHVAQPDHSDLRQSLQRSVAVARRGAAGALLLNGVAGLRSVHWFHQDFARV